MLIKTISIQWNNFSLMPGNMKIKKNKMLFNVGGSISLIKLKVIMGFSAFYNATIGVKSSTRTKEN